ncbi:hypothetical protein A5482_011210 [Cyanobacterium sp. IPPAS B-1200]|uniref:hypothetical protein n=1 Tax=Cyanobacterium sp. IPPAS B-1200 TaxID=1562720 RepID=UPI0019119456|nr:hypothetical protein [Cyanobacterium sp. IPPAS B-1200]
MNSYTNTILTVIAICLVIIIIELAQPINAQRSILDVNIKGVGGSNVFRKVPMKIK